MSDHCHDHCHTPTASSNPRYRTVLWIALVINALMFGVEVLGSAHANSMSLLADAVDFAGDAANYGLSLAVLSMAMLSFITNVKGIMLDVGLSETLTDKLLANSGWRFLMISGAFPALLIFLIRLFVPESEKWTAEKEKGSTSHWANVDLLGVLAGSFASLSIIWAWSPAGLSPLPAIGVTLLGLAVAIWGFLHPVRCYLRRSELAGMINAGEGRTIVKMMLFGAGLAAVALLGTWGSTQWAPRWAAQLEPDPLKHAKEWTLIWLSAGAITGTMAAALAAGRFGRRITYAVLCVGSILGALILYQGNTGYGAFFLPATSSRVV